MNELTTYAAAEKALIAAVTAEQVKTVRLSAIGLQAMAKEAKNFGMIVNAVKLRVLAEAKLGGMLAEAEKQGLFRRGRNHDKKANSSEKVELTRVFVKDIGITHKLSAQAQQLNAMGEAPLKKLIQRFEQESIETGRVAVEVFKTEERDRRHEQRVNLQQVLSDRSAELRSGRKFPVIYADPATKFVSGQTDRSIENHYPTETMESLCAMPVANRCLPACQLFIWTTVPQLANTITRILPAWGNFKYSSHCMWDKTSEDHERESGTGLVFRNQHEVLIYATRGNPPGPKFHPLSIYRERKTTHSRKPEYYRTMIEKMVGGLPVLELFARKGEYKLPKGWETWGNEAEVKAAPVTAKSAKRKVAA